MASGMPTSSTVSTKKPPTATPSTSKSRRRTTNSTTTKEQTKNKSSTFSYPERRGPVRPVDSLNSYTKPKGKTTGGKSHYVFVYGTLKRGFANAHLLDRATCLGDFRTLTKYPLVIGGQFHSPYLLDMPNRGANVKGEVYVVDDAILADLDHLENVGVNYSRKIAKVSSATDRAFVVDVFVYFKVNGMEKLVQSQFLEDYQCRKYVPRHLRSNNTKNPVGVEKRVPANVVS